MSSAILAFLHYVGILVAFSGLTFRISSLKEAHSSRKTKDVLAADNLYGLGIMLALGTGLLRAFSGFEKGTDFYLSNTFFWLKMALFISVFLIELGPMIFLIKTRLAKLNEFREVDMASVARSLTLSRLEWAAFLCLPLLAALMARGF